LKDCYPKNAQTIDKDTYFIVASKLNPVFDFNNPQTEQQFVRTVITHGRESNHEPSPSTQTLLIKIWMDKWPKSISLSFRQFLGDTENKTIRQFLQNLSNFCEIARSSRLACEQYGWSVVGNNNTSYSGPSRDPPGDKGGSHKQHGNDSNKRQKNRRRKTFFFFFVFFSTI
jgi:hypothetical protein